MTTKKIPKKMSVLRKILCRRTSVQIIFEISQLLWGYPLYLLSFLCPKNKQKWVFGHKTGFADNAKYLYLYALKLKEVKVYWITSDKKLIKWMRNRNLPVYHKYGLKGIYHCLTSHLYIYATSPNAINFFTSGNSKLVNLWHGIGGTKDMRTSHSGLGDNNLLSKICMPYTLKKPDFFLTTSPFEKEIFKEVFSINNKQILDGIYPRCDFLRQDLSTIIEHIRLYEDWEISDLLEKWKQYNKVYLYMPTWRADLSSNYLDIALPDMDRLDEVLKKTNALLIIKQHPIVKADKKNERYSNIYFFDNQYDIYPVIPFTDILITDYSTIYSDYILLEKKGVIVYPFDLDNYQKTDYKLLADYKDNTPGTYVYTFSELLGLIESKDECIVTNRSCILSKFWGDYKNKSIKDLYLQLLKIS